MDRRPWLPYVLPFALFVVLTELQRHVPGGMGWGYRAKTVLVAVLLVALRRWLRPEGGVFALAAAGTGIVVLVLWILPEGRYPLLGAGTPFDPFQSFSREQVYLWIGVRLLGAAVIVPVVEEFFWRGFLIRWLVSADFRSVRLGTFTWYSFLATSVLFAVEHDRWLPGLMAGVAYNLLYYRTRSLKACIVSHAVTNLGLGLYVLATARWEFW
jgi:hypothetical protein